MTLGQTLRGEARDALIFTGSNILNKAAGLLLLPLYWTKLSPADYGVLAIITILGAFQALLSSLSLDLAITRFYYEWAPERRRANLGAIWTWNWGLTALVTVAFLGAVPAVAPALFPDVTDGSLLSLGVIANGLANLFLIPASTVRIKRLPWLFAAYNVIGFAIQAGLGLWLVLVQSAGLGGLLTAMATSGLILAGIGLAVMLRFATPGLRSPDLHVSFRFAMRAVPAAIINTLAQVMDRLLLGSFSDLATLGLYSIALRFAEVIGVLHVSLKMAFGPFLMRSVAEGGAAGRRLVTAVTPYYLIPYFVLAVALSLFIGPLLRLIGRPEYLGVESIVPWLAGLQILLSIPAYYANGLTLGKRTELLSIPATALASTTIVLSILLVEPFQVAGIVVSRYVGAIVFVWMMIQLSQRVWPMRHQWSVLVELSAVSAAFAIGGQAVSLDRGLMEVVIKILAMTAFLAVAWKIARTHEDASVGSSPREDTPYRRAQSPMRAAQPNHQQSPSEGSRIPADEHRRPDLP